MAPVSSPLSKNSLHTSLSQSPLSRFKEFSSDFFPSSWRSLLSGVVAYVDVRTDSDNRSKSIASELESLGATVVSCFSKKVTHVIFKDGSKPIYDKAKAMGIPILSYLWIVACKEKGEMAPTQGHQAINSQDYDSPYFKWRKVKSMQPKDVEEEMKLAERRVDRRRKRIQQGLFLDNNKPDTLQLPYTPVLERKSVIDTLIESSPLVQERIQNELAAGKTCADVFTIKEGEEDDFDTFFDTPLMIKFIARNYYSPRDPTPSSIKNLLAESKCQSATPVAGCSSIPRKPLVVQENPVATSPPSPVNQSGKKRKTRASTSSIPDPKKRKENVEELAAVPRRKLLFQPQPKLPLPEDPVVATTPDASPKSKKRHNPLHPCFNQPVVSVMPSDLRMKSSTCSKPTSKKEASRRSLRRDSLADFRLSSPKKRQPKLVTFVCTSLHSKSTALAQEAVDELNGFTISDTVDDSTSLVVCGDARRTMNVMRGIVRGIKIVSFQWVVDSKAQGLWLQEDRYPVARFSEASALYRTGTKTLFDGFESIYVSSRSRIPPSDLCDLIKCAGGRLVNVSKRASLIVGQWKAHTHVPCVCGTWVLDSIEKGTALPPSDYLLTS